MTMMLLIIFATFFIASQGLLFDAGPGLSSRKKCQVSMTDEPQPTGFQPTGFICKKTAKCVWDKKRSIQVPSYMEYNCPIALCTSKYLVKGKCNRNVCACEDSSGNSKIGQIFKYEDKNFDYECSCEADPDYVAVCGANCTRTRKPIPEIVPPKAPRPQPSFPNFPGFPPFKK